MMGQITPEIHLQWPEISHMLITTKARQNLNSWNRLLICSNSVQKNSSILIFLKIQVFIWLYLPNISLTKRMPLKARKRGHIVQNIIIYCSHFFSVLKNAHIILQSKEHNFKILLKLPWARIRCDRICMFLLF